MINSGIIRIMNTTSHEKDKPALPKKWIVPIRLAVYARREEIAIQRLVGATSWFVRTPFLLEGAFWGLIGGAASVTILLVADTVVAPQLTQAITDVLGGLLYDAPLRPFTAFAFVL